MTTRVISARIAEDVARLLHEAAAADRVSKRQFLEEAIRLRAREHRQERMRKALDESFGIMKRDEPPEETVRKIKEEATEARIRRWRRLGASDEELRDRGILG
jgi:hypothetical protein